MNCNGCHANGGGGMGPPLMDDEWRYGGEIEQIVAHHRRGPAERHARVRREQADREQIWQLAAYVRSLSAQTPQDTPRGPRRRAQHARTALVSRSARPSAG